MLTSAGRFRVWREEFVKAAVVHTPARARQGSMALPTAVQVAPLVASRTKVELNARPKSMSVDLCHVATVVSAEAHVVKKLAIRALAQLESTVTIVRLTAMNVRRSLACTEEHAARVVSCSSVSV